MAIAMGCLSTLVSVPARADPAWTIDDQNKHDRPTTVDFTAAAWVFGDTTFFGGAGWFCYPIVPEGLIPSVNDSFYLEVGAFIFDYNVHVSNGADYSYVGIFPAGGVRWDFHLTREWTVFATAKLGIRIGTGDAPRTWWLDGGGSIGAYWKFSKAMYVRLETGNLGLVSAGISIVL